MIEANRFVGRTLPSPVTPIGTTCIIIEIPNAVEYLAAFFGQLEPLGNWWHWEHMTDGTDHPECEEAAQLWRTAIWQAQKGVCNMALDVRQSPENCKILQKYVGGSWLTFADFTPCIPTNESIRAFLLNDITFIQTINEGLLGSLPEDDGGNVYPPMPNVGGSVALCNAATYIVEQIRALIADVFVRLSSAITPQDVMLALGGQQGWSVASLYALVTTNQANLANEIAVLAAFDGASEDLICQLIQHNLDKAPVVSWVQATLAGSIATRDAIVYALQASEGRYALWATVGATIITADCTDCGIIEQCFEYNLNPAASSTAGLFTGRTVTAGDLIEITATGSWLAVPAGTSLSAEGEPGIFANYVAPDINAHSLIAQIQGEGLRTWHRIGEDGSFNAPQGGALVVNMNHYFGEGSTPNNVGQYSNSSGSFALDICITPGPVYLVPYGFPEGAVTETSANHYDLLNYSTGNYVTHSSVSVDLVAFKIVSYTWEGPGDEQYAQVQVGGGFFAYNAIPDSVATTSINIQFAPAGKILRVVIVRA